MVEHFYQKIPGFFDFQQLYTRAVNEAPEKAHFIEVGVSHGQSAAYLAVEIANSNKEITLDLVDLWGTWNDRSPTPETVKTNLAPIIDLTPINIIQKSKRRRSQRTQRPHTRLHIHRRQPRLQQRPKRHNQMAPQTKKRRNPSWT